MVFVPGRTRIHPNCGKDWNCGSEPNFLSASFLFSLFGYSAAQL